MPEISKPTLKDFGISQVQVDNYEGQLSQWQQNVFQDGSENFAGFGLLLGGGFGLYLFFWRDSTAAGIADFLALVGFSALFGAMFGGFLGKLLGATIQKPSKPSEPAGLQRYQVAEGSYRVALANAAKKLEAHEKEIAERVYLQRRKVADFWLSLSGYEFEVEMMKLFEGDGYRVTLTKQSGDGGVDLRLELNGKKYIVQCKAQKNPVGPHVVRDLFGVMNHENSDGGIVVTTATFTKGAQDFAHDKDIELVDLEFIIGRAIAQSK